MDAAHARRCRYLYHDRGRKGLGNRVRRHHHAFWQLDLTLSGVQYPLATGAPAAVRAGETICYPPGVAHAIDYQPRTRYRSLKVAIEGIREPPTALVLPSCPSHARLHACIDDCLPDDALPPDPGAAARLGHLVLALLAEVTTAQGATAASGDDALCAQMAEILRRREGRALAVAELAAAVGLSPGRLSARLRAAMGRSAKQVIDEARAAVAVRLLAYGDRGIAEIAELLEFPDRFAFGRFVRRVSGRTPARWRREVEAASDYLAGRGSGIAANQP